MLYKESLWVVTCSACRQLASFYTGTIHSSVLFPFLYWNSFPFSISALDITLWTQVPYTVLGQDDWKWCLKYIPKPMNLKIESAHPHKSPAAYISWYHKLLVISINKIEGIRQKEVSLWQPLGATRYVGRGIMKHDNLLLTLTSCWKDTNLNQSPWRNQGGLLLTFSAK